MLALALALQLLASGMGPTPPAPGSPRFVQVGAFAGLPPDSIPRADFVRAFRAVFAEDDLPGERLDAGHEWVAAGPLPNRFRLLEGDAAFDAWQLDVRVGAPPPLKVPGRSAGKSARVVPTRRSSRGMIVAFTLRIPDPDGGAPRVLESRAAFALPAPGEADADAPRVVPNTGYAFSWSDAGHVAGTLALEMLLHESGDHAAGERMAIAPAVRLDAGR